MLLKMKKNQILDSRRLTGIPEPSSISGKPIFKDSSRIIG
jgi:hypothetical protein